MGTETPAVEIVKNGLEQARANKNDYVLIDTAGRLQIDETLACKSCMILKILLIQTKFSWLWIA